MKINLGCGNDIRSDCINVDISKHRPEIDIVWNLNHLLWPFDSNKVDAIYALSVFEHLVPNLVTVMNECWRILKPDGLLYVKYPLYSSPTIHDDPTHIWAWSDKVLDYFDDNTEYGKSYGFYTPYRWQIVEKKTHKNLSCHAQLVKLVK